MQHGVPLFRINTISFGAENPAGDNKTREGRADEELGRPRVGAEIDACRVAARRDEHRHQHGGDGSKPEDERQTCAHIRSGRRPGRLFRYNHDARARGRYSVSLVVNRAHGFDVTGDRGHRLFPRISGGNLAHRVPVLPAFHRQSREMPAG